MSLTGGGETPGPYPGNGTSILLDVDLTGFSDIVISFATRGTSTGYDLGVWSYSVDGAGFIELEDISTATRVTTFGLATVDFSAVTGLNNQSDVVFSYTLSGATSAGGNNRIDNLLIVGSPIPEPSSYAAIFGGLALAGVMARRRRHA